MAHWVMAGGAMAVMVPAVSTGSTVLASDNALDYYAAALDGLVLLGGNDVDPQHYGEDPLHEDWRGDRVRDQYEMALIRAFVAGGKPVLAQRGIPETAVAEYLLMAVKVPSAHGLVRPVSAGQRPLRQVHDPLSLPWPGSTSLQQA